MKRGDIFELSFNEGYYKISFIDSGHWVIYYEMDGDRRDTEMISKGLFKTRAHIIDESAYENR